MRSVRINKSHPIDYVRVRFVLAWNECNTYSRSFAFTSCLPFESNILFITINSHGQGGTRILQRNQWNGKDCQIIIQEVDRHKYRNNATIVYKGIIHIGYLFRFGRITTDKFGTLWQGIWYISRWNGTNYINEPSQNISYATSCSFYITPLWRNNNHHQNHIKYIDNYGVHEIIVWRMTSPKICFFIWCNNTILTVLQSHRSVQQHTSFTMLWRMSTMLDRHCHLRRRHVSVPSARH